MSRALISGLHVLPSPGCNPSVNRLERMMPLNNLMSLTHRWATRNGEMRPAFSYIVRKGTSLGLNSVCGSTTTMSHVASLVRSHVPHCHRRNREDRIATSSEASPNSDWPHGCFMTCRRNGTFPGDTKGKIAPLPVCPNIDKRLHDATPLSKDVSSAF